MTINGLYFTFTETVIYKLSFYTIKLLKIKQNFDKLFYFNIFFKLLIVLAMAIWQYIINSKISSILLLLTKGI